MKPFETLTAISAPLRIMNVDTDMIIPKQFLRTIKRTGLGKSLFFEMRFDDKGNEIADFVLNKPQYKNAEILVTGENFGCGSSREHAPWALLDFGIRCVIAPSYADIFYNNCFKNGILPVKLPKEDVEQLMQMAEDGKNITINLPEQKVVCGNHTFNFEIDPFRKHCLMNGLDDIALTEEKKSFIDSFENNDKQNRNWLYA